MRYRIQAACESHDITHDPCPELRGQYANPFAARQGANCPDVMQPGCGLADDGV